MNRAIEWAAFNDDGNLCWAGMATSETQAMELAGPDAMVAWEVTALWPNVAHGARQWIAARSAWIQNLGRSLAAAGALCEAFEVGWQSRADFAGRASYWLPGCGRSVP